MIFQREPLVIAAAHFYRNMPLCRPRNSIEAVNLLHSIMLNQFTFLKSG